MRAGPGKFRQKPFEYAAFLCCLNRMKKNLLSLAGVVFAALAFTSCYYDPYYSGSSVSGSYSSGYGDGYGYGGSSFNTSVFVSTGNPRWGYDPYNYSYYDYSSRRYYDPYLDGYYPIGYRPPVVYGVPHPYGYRNGYCPPPRRVHSGYVSNYRNREVAYRNSRYGWAKQVRQQSPSQGRPIGSRSDNNYRRQEQYQGRPSSSRDSRSRESARPSSRQQDSRQSSRYNTPVKSQYSQKQYNPKSQQYSGGQRQPAQRQQAQRQQAQRGKAQPQQRQQPREASRGGGGERKSSNKDDGKRYNGYR